MKNCSLSLAAVAAGLFISMGAQASGSDGTLYFSGSLSNSTCTATSPSSSSTNAIAMPSGLPVSDFKSAGDTAGTTYFTINFAGCTAGGQATASTYFQANPADVDMTNGYLLNSGTATGVEIAIYNTDSTLINVAQTYGNQNVKSVPIAATATSGSQSFLAKYIGLSATPGAGTVKGQVSFNMTYQ